MTLKIKRSSSYSGQTVNFKNTGRGGSVKIAVTNFVYPPAPPPSSAPVPATYLTLPVVAKCVPEDGLSNVLGSKVAWYYVQLTGTSNVTFDTEGSTPSDTMIGVYDSTGARLGFDDDSGTGALSSLTLSGLTAGLYYIAVCYYNASFGATGWSVTGTGSNLVANCSLKLNVTLS